MSDQKNIPLRVRVTAQENAKYRRAMETLGLTEISTFVRWALDNSAEQVLRGAVKRQAPPPEPVAPTPAPMPSIADVLGVPLYGGEPRPLTEVEGDDWV